MNTEGAVSPQVLALFCALYVILFALFYYRHHTLLF